MKLDTSKLTVKNVVQIFDVTPMTIWNWKEGFDKKKTVSFLATQFHTVLNIVCISSGI